MERGTKALIHHLREQAPGKLLVSGCDTILTPRNFPSTSSSSCSVYALPPRRRACFCRSRPVQSLHLQHSRDAYVDARQYPYTPSGALSWDYRKEQILQEIQAHDAEFICLQEVAAESFEEFFSMRLAHTDYKGVF